MGWSDQPYVYAGNNPLTNVDPSGQRFAAENGAQARVAMSYQRRVVARVQPKHPAGPAKQTTKKQTSQNAARPKYHLAFTLALHITIAPNWLNADAVFDFLRAAAYAGGAVLAIAAGIALFNAGPEAWISSIAAIVQGIDFLVHALTEIFRAVFGADSGVYNIFSALTVILDIVSLFFDGLALSSVGAEGAAAEVAAPMLSRILKNATALHEIAGFLSVDVGGILSDLNAIVDGHLP